MENEIGKKAKKLGADLLLNIIGFVGGFFIAMIAPKPFNYVGWLFLVICGLGFIAGIAMIFSLRKEEKELKIINEIRQCPSCAEDIRKAAKKCKHCGEILT